MTDLRWFIEERDRRNDLLDNAWAVIVIFLAIVVML